jgi:hypothetical protein
MRHRLHDRRVTLPTSPRLKTPMRVKQPLDKQARGSAYTHHDVKRTGYVGGGKLRVLQLALGNTGCDAVL